MKIAENYSIIVIPKDRAKIRRWIISRERVLGTLSMAVGFVLFTAVMCLGLVHYHKEYLATADLRNRGEQYEKERIQVLARLSELESVVQQNDQLASRLENIVGLNNNEKGVQVGVGGDDGGPAIESAFQLASLLPETLQGQEPRIFNENGLKVSNLKTIDLLEEAKDVGDRLNDVYHFNPDAGYFWTSMPTVSPLNGWVTSNFGMRRSPVTGRRQFHEGMDIASPYGSPVAATGDGVITFAGKWGGLGNKVVIDHGYGIVTVYGHNSKILVNVGDKIHRGQIIAKVGSTGRSTGPHVHYEVFVDGVPVNPERYILE